MTVTSHPMALLRSRLPAGSIDSRELGDARQRLARADRRPGGSASAPGHGRRRGLRAARGRVRGRQPDRAARGLRAPPADGPDRTATAGRGQARASRPGGGAINVLVNRVDQIAAPGGLVAQVQDFSAADERVRAEEQAAAGGDVDEFRGGCAAGDELRGRAQAMTRLARRAARSHDNVPGTWLPWPSSLWSFTALAVAVAYGASRGTFRGIARAVMTTSRSGSRLLNSTLAVVYIGCGICVPLLFIFGNYDKSNAQVNGIKADASMQVGRELSASTARSATRLAADNAVGKTGPNLDALSPRRRSSCTRSPTAVCRSRRSSAQAPRVSATARCRPTSSRAARLRTSPRSSRRIAGHP